MVSTVWIGRWRHVQIFQKNILNALAVAGAFTHSCLPFILICIIVRDTKKMSAE